MKRVFVIFLVIFVITANAQDVNDELCDRQLTHYQEALRVKENWALELFDTWTKMQSGISTGNAVDFGHYDQCLAFRHASSADIGEIRGQYCVIYYRATANASEVKSESDFHWTDIGSIFRERRLRLAAGVCLPAVCSTAKIQAFVNAYLASADLVITGDYQQALFCRTSDSPPLEIIDIIAIVLATVLLCLLALSTIYEMVMIKRNRKRNPFYASFSMYTNGKRLIEMKTESSVNVIKCLPGLRTFAMLHIMLGHRYLLWQANANINANTYRIGSKWSQSFMASLVNTNSIAVDSFFVMGGLLLSKSILAAIEKKKFNIPRMFLHRYLRVMPVLALLILFTVSLFKFVGDGPLFESRSSFSMVDACKERWWATMLYVHNYLQPIGSCLEVSWYLAVDYQLVLVSPFVMYPIFKWGWKFMWLLPTYIVATIVWKFIAVFMNEYKAAASLMSREMLFEYYERFYYSTHIRCSVWMMGVLLGYYLHNLKGQKIKINKFLNATLWIASFTVIFSVILGSAAFRTIEYPPSTLANAFYLACQRQVWGLAITWIIFACEMNRGGVVRMFLELPCWQPLGRISLGFYLVHTFPQFLHLTSIKVPLYFSDINVWHHLASDLLTSVLLASFLFLAVEEPVLNIENSIYKWNAKRESKEASSKQ